MKSFCIFLLTFLISSCASIDTSRIAPGYSEAFKNIKQYFLGAENEIELDVIASIPYASMLVRIGNGPTALMILESKKDEEYTWVSADGVYLVLKNGRIVKTSGLINNLRDNFTTNKKWEDDLYNKQKFVSYYSFSQPTLNNLKVTSSYEKGEEQDIELLVGKKRLRIIKEELFSEDVAWYETNLYWVDKSNFVWKSVQSISPRLPEIYFEVTKKPL